MAEANQASEVVRGIGTFTNFWKNVERAIRSKGGTDEHLAHLGRAECQSAIECFAQQVVEDLNPKSFPLRKQFGTMDEALEGCRFDHQYWSDHAPISELKASFSIDGQYRIGALRGVVTTAAIRHRYPTLASFHELIAYVYTYGYRTHPLATSWTDSKSIWWSARVMLNLPKYARVLIVSQDRSCTIWDEETRFLVRV